MRPHDEADAPPPPDDDHIDAVIRLSPSADAPARARQFVVDHQDHLPADVVQDAQLLVSEVVSNAVVHGRTAILLRVRVRPPGIGVAVADTGAASVDTDTALPTAGATSGRGLAIVAALATAWGVDETQPPPGKTVWFELAAERPVAGD